MNKKQISFFVLFLAIIVLVIGIFFVITKQTTLQQGNNQANILSGTNLNVPGYIFYDYNNGDGTCWRGIYLDDGTPIAVYNGTWAQGTGECRLAIKAPRPNSYAIMSSVGTNTTFTVSSGEEYFKSEAAMKLLQLKLVQANVFPFSKVTGTFTPDTFLAIKAFQTKNNLPVTGYPNAATVEALNRISFTTTPVKRSKDISSISAPSEAQSVSPSLSPTIKR